LHGGLKGFDKVIWQVSAKSFDEHHASITLRHTSPEKDEGYPGLLDIQVVYTLSSAGTLRIDYKAETTKPTFVNLTNHAYFNLDGHEAQGIEDHMLQMSASHFTPVDSTLIPIGELTPVEGGPFDFLSSQRIGERIDANDEQIRYGGGYDHNFVLDNPSLNHPSVIASSEESGISLSIYTTEPGVQFYTGNFLDGSLIGKSGAVYQRRSGFCLETQHFPDSPNQPSFPTTRLNPGDEYRTTTIYEVGLVE